MSALTRLATGIDAVTTALGRAVAWLVLGVVTVQFAVVVMRYVFGAGSIMAQEAVVYLHAAGVLLAAAWVLKADGHVRVDVFYARWSVKRRAAVDLFGTLFLLWPVAALILWAGTPFAREAWRVLEGSRDAGGIPAVFLLKTLVPAFGALMLLQGLSQAAKALAVLAAKDGAGS